MATGISFDQINTTLMLAAGTADTSLEAAIKKFNAIKSPTATDGLVVQQAIQQWSASFELAAKANERVGEMFKSIAQKS